jgi:hypothetical protein
MFNLAQQATKEAAMRCRLSVFAMGVSALAFAACGNQMSSDVRTLSGEGIAKVQVCHHTSSATNPVVVIEISPSAVDTHIVRHGDGILDANGNCCVPADGPCGDGAKYGCCEGSACASGKCVQCIAEGNPSGEACGDAAPCCDGLTCNHGKCEGGGGGSCAGSACDPTQEGSCCDGYDCDAEQKKCIALDPA